MLASFKLFYKIFIVHQQHILAIVEDAGHEVYAQLLKREVTANIVELLDAYFSEYFRKMNYLWC